MDLSDFHFFVLLVFACFCFVLFVFCVVVFWGGCFFVFFGACFCFSFAFVYSDLSCVSQAMRILKYAKRSLYRKSARPDRICNAVF